MSAGDPAAQAGLAHSLTLEITCVDLPGATFHDYAHITLGVQRGKEVVHEIAADAERAMYCISLGVHLPDAEGRPDFSGPYVHGKPGERFIYLCWRGQRGADRSVFRRAKLSLARLTQAQIEQAAAANLPLRAVIRMQDRSRGPVAATIRPDQVVWQP